MGAPILMYFSDIALVPIHRSQSTRPQLRPLRTANLGSSGSSSGLVFPGATLKHSDGSVCATARDRTRVREAPPALPVFVTKPQNRPNSDDSPEGGLAKGTSPAKASEIKAIIGSDCAQPDALC